MGRPVKRDVNGTLVFGDYAATAAGIKVTAYVPGGSSAVAGFIVKQVGSRRYKVTTAQGTGKCKLVAATPGEGEMVMLGYTNPGADVSVAIRHLRKRTAIDFSGNRYTWVLVNDSSEDYIELTLVDAAD